MEDKLLSITCPLCGRRSEHPINSLKEGSDLVCPLCRVKLNLHGHMLEDIQKEIARLKNEQ